jgi:hypothetical protein
MAVSLLMQIQDYNRRKKIKTDYVAGTADGGYVSERNILRTFKSVLEAAGRRIIRFMHSGIHLLLGC